MSHGLVLHMKNHRKSWKYGLITALLLISASFTVIPFSCLAEGNGNYPPPSSGDWVITVDTYVRNEDITVQGNITIENDAQLTLDNVTLRIYASAYGDARISVKNGSELNVINGSIIMEGESQINYDFIFENGSKGKIQNSTIEDCGWNDGGTLRSTSGILIASDNVTVDNSTIQNNQNGLVLYYASPVIKYNIIRDNAKYGIAVWGGSPQIIGNEISLNPVGVYSYNSELTLIDNNIYDNGDGAKFYYSSVYMEGGRISSNSRDDCSTGTCSPSESGKGIYVEMSNLTLSNSEISENSDDGLISYNSKLDIDNSTFANNINNGILGYYSEADLKDNIFSNNSLYGIEWMYSDIEVDDSNLFMQNNGAGRIIVKWSVTVNVTDSYGDDVSSARVDFEGEYEGHNYDYLTYTNILGIADSAIAQYEIVNNGSYIDHNPYTITAKKTAPWDGVEYSNFTVININDNTAIDIRIPLKKPDLKLESISFSDTPRVGEKVNIKIKLINLGHASANDAEIWVTQKDSHGGMVVVNITTVSINSYDSLELPIAWIPEQEGEAVVRAVVKTVYDEMDKENNEFEITVNVQSEKKTFYEEPYFLAGLGSFIFILVGVSIYILALRKKVDEV